MKKMFFALFAFFSMSVYAQKAGQGLQFDLGTEPQENSNTSFGIIQYGWTETAASRIDVKFTNFHKTEIGIEGYKIEGYGDATDVHKAKIFELSILPFVKYFGGEKKFSVSAGFSYKYQKESQNSGMTDINGLMLEHGDEGKYFTVNYDKTIHFIMPIALEFTSSLPVYFPYFESVLNFEFLLHPFYLASQKRDVNYHAENVNTPFDYSGKDDFFAVSAPYIFAKATFDFLNYFRLLTQISYQRLKCRQMDWAEDFNSLEGKDDVQNMTTFRFGLELLTSKNAKARVRAGVYRQIEWNNSSFRGDTEKESKWIFSFGTEM